MKSKTKMEAAFDKAGVIAPKAQLAVIADEIIAEKSGSDKAVGVLFERLFEPDPIQYEFLQSYCREAALSCLRDATRRMKGRGQYQRDIQMGRAPSTTKRNGGGQGSSGAQSSSATPVSSSPRTLEAMAAASQVVAEGILERSFRVSGQKSRRLGDMLPPQALAIADNKEAFGDSLHAQARMLRMICHDLPHNKPIRESLDAEEAEHRFRLSGGDNVH